MGFVGFGRERRRRGKQLMRKGGRHGLVRHDQYGLHVVQPMHAMQGRMWIEKALQERRGWVGGWSSGQTKKEKQILVKMRNREGGGMLLRREGEIF